MDIIVEETHSVMPARPPMGRDKGGIQALDRAFFILDIIDRKSVV